MTKPSRRPFLASLRCAGRIALRLPRLFWFAIALLWGAGIWWLSNRPPSAEESTVLGSWISNMAHAPLFGLLALWLALALPREQTQLGHEWARSGLLDFRLVFWSVAIYGLVDEFHQASVPGRNPSIFDLFTDWSAAYITLGVAAAAGRASMEEPAMRRRLAKGVLICCLAGLAATFA